MPFLPNLFIGIPYFQKAEITYQNLQGWKLVSRLKQKCGFRKKDNLPLRAKAQRHFAIKTVAEKTVSMQKKKMKKWRTDLKIVIYENGNEEYFHK